MVTASETTRDMIQAEKYRKIVKKLMETLESGKLSPESKKKLQAFRDWLGEASKISAEDLNMILR